MINNHLQIMYTGVFLPLLLFHLSFCDREKEKIENKSGIHSGQNDGISEVEEKFILKKNDLEKLKIEIPLDLDSTETPQIIHFEDAGILYEFFGYPKKKHWDMIQYSDHCGLLDFDNQSLLIRLVNSNIPDFKLKVYYNGNNEFTAARKNNRVLRFKYSKYRNTINPNWTVGYLFSFSYPNVTPDQNNAIFTAHTTNAQDAYKETLAQCEKNIIEMYQRYEEEAKTTEGGPVPPE